MKSISNAIVTLYKGSGVAGTWKIGDCQNTVSGDGLWWHVFTIDGKTNQLKWNCRQGPEGMNWPGGSEFNTLSMYKMRKNHTLFNETDDMFSPNATRKKLTA